MIERYERLIVGIDSPPNAQMDSTAYLAPEGFTAELRHEIGPDATEHGRLLVAPGPPRPAAWVENVWHEPRRFHIASIKDGARRLRAIQRNWALYSYQRHRRAALIQGELPKVSAKPLVFPQSPPAAPLGSWTLTAADEILAAPSCASLFPNGAPTFVEDKTGPPNRAYLKLWEALTVIGRTPKPGERCLDLGAAPGGWTWALAELGARVVAVDRAPLAPGLAERPNVESLKASAFGLRPADVGPVDWLFSDVVCYPARLHRMVSDWLESGLARNLVCTVKFQGKTDFDAQRLFARIPDSRLVHLHHNKHELTWIKLAP